MALTTPNSLIRLALKASGAIGEGQTPSAENVNDALDILNLMITEWQLYRWLIYDLIDTSKTSTGTTSYTVGPSQDFNVAVRPDKLDAVFCRLISNSNDTYLYSYIARESYDRVISKATTGVPYAFFYDPGLASIGTLYLYPVPASTYSIHIQYKASLGQFASLTQTITLPQPYVAAMLWNLAASLRPLFGLPEDPQVSQRAAATLSALANSIAQVPNAVMPTPSNRAGAYSVIVPGSESK